LQADQVLGPVVLVTREKNITLDRVQGSVQLTNRNGSVNVTNTSPLSQITISNQHGSVDLGVPEHAGFVLQAQTKNGDIENDFGLEPMETAHVNVLTGTIGNGGPTVKVDTSDGDVTISKSSVAPLPPTPPAAPRITVKPPPAPHPIVPKVPKLPALPKVPAAPDAPGA